MFFGFTLKELPADFRTEMIFLAPIGPAIRRLVGVYFHPTNRVNGKGVARPAIGLHFIHQVLDSFVQWCFDGYRLPKAIRIYPKVLVLCWPRIAAL